MHLHLLPFLPSGSATDVAVFTAEDIFLQKPLQQRRGFLFTPPPLKGCGGFRVFSSLLSYSKYHKSGLLSIEHCSTKGRILLYTLSAIISARAL